jgi:hypothetical protein
VIFQWIGVVQYIPCYGAPAVHWGLLPATRLASRKILIEQNIQRRTGPALYVFSLLESTPGGGGFRNDTLNGRVKFEY